jgi:hypothetical protein
MNGSTSADAQAWRSILDRFQAEHLLATALSESEFCRTLATSHLTRLLGPEEQQRRWDRLAALGPLPLAAVRHPIIRERFGVPTLITVPEAGDRVRFGEFAGAWLPAVDMMLAGDQEPVVELFAYALSDASERLPARVRQRAIDDLWSVRWFLLTSDAAPFMRAEILATGRDCEYVSPEAEGREALKNARAMIDAARHRNGSLDDWLEDLFKAKLSVGYAQEWLRRAADIDSRRRLRMADEISADILTTMMRAMQQVVRPDDRWLSAQHLPLELDRLTRAQANEVSRKLHFQSRARVGLPNWWVDRAMGMLELWPTEISPELDDFDPLLHAGRFITVFGDLFSQCDDDDLTRTREALRIGLSGTESQIASALETLIDPRTGFPHIRRPDRE